MGVVVFLVGPRACEGDLVTLAILVEVVVDELATIVGVQAHQREWDALGDVVYGSTDPRVASIATVTEGYSLRQMEVLPKLAQMIVLEE